MKVYTADAILRAKLLYGLESSQLIPSVAKRMETLQLKVLRKIFRLNTTFIDREITTTLSFKEQMMQWQQRTKTERKRKKSFLL